MNIRTLATAFAAAALFGLTAAPARAQTAAPGAVPPPADAQAASAKPKANTAGPPHSEGDELTQSQSRLAGGGRARLCKLDNCARGGESRQKGVD